VPIILPKNACGTVAHRLAALDSKLAVELYEHDSAMNILEKIDPGARATWPPGWSRIVNRTHCSRSPARRWMQL